MRLALPYPEKPPSNVFFEPKNLGDMIAFGRITPPELHFELQRRFLETGRTIEDMMMLARTESLNCEIHQVDKSIKVIIKNYPFPLIFNIEMSSEVLPDIFHPCKISLDKSKPLSDSSNLVEIGRAVLLMAIGYTHAKEYLLNLPRPTHNDPIPKDIADKSLNFVIEYTSKLFRTCAGILNKKNFLTKLSNENIVELIDELSKLNRIDESGFLTILKSILNAYKAIIKYIPDKDVNRLRLGDSLHTLEQFYDYFTKDNNQYSSNNILINYLHLMQICFLLNTSQGYVIASNPILANIFMESLEEPSIPTYSEKELKKYTECLAKFINNQIKTPKFKTREGLKALRYSDPESINHNVLRAETSAFWAKTALTILENATSKNWDDVKFEYGRAIFLFHHIYQSIVLESEISVPNSDRSISIALFAAATFINQVDFKAVGVLKLLSKQMLEITGQPIFTDKEDLHSWLQFHTRPQCYDLQTPPWFDLYHYSESSKVILDKLLRPYGIETNYTEFFDLLHEQVRLESALITYLRGGSSNNFINLAFELGIETDFDIYNLAYSVIEQAKKGFFASFYEERSRFSDGDLDQSGIRRLEDLKKELEKTLYKKQEIRQKVEELERGNQKLPLSECLLIWGLRQSEIEDITKRNPTIANIFLRGFSVESAKRFLLKIFSLNDLKKISIEIPELFDLLTSGNFDQTKLKIIKDNLSSILRGKIKITVIKRINWAKGKRLRHVSHSDNELGERLSKKSENFRVNLILLDDPSGLLEAAATLSKFGLTDDEIIQVFNKNNKIMFPPEKGSRTFGDFFYYDYLDTMLGVLNYNENDIKRFILKHPSSLTPEFRDNVQSLKDLFEEKKILAQLGTAIKRHKALVTTPIETIISKSHAVAEFLSNSEVIPYPKYLDGSKLPDTVPLDILSQIIGFHPELIEFYNDRAKAILSILKANFNILTIRDVARASDLNPYVLEASFSHPQMKGDFFVFAHQLEKSVILTYGDNAVRTTISKWKALGLSDDDIIVKLKATQITKDNLAKNSSSNEITLN